MSERLNTFASMAAKPVTLRQLKYIQRLSREHGADEAATRALVQEIYGCGIDQMTIGQASDFIENLPALIGNRNGG